MDEIQPYVDEDERMEEGELIPDPQRERPAEQDRNILTMDELVRTGASRTEIDEFFRRQQALVLQRLEEQRLATEQAAARTRLEQQQQQVPNVAQLMQERNQLLYANQRMAEQLAAAVTLEGALRSGADRGGDAQQRLMQGNVAAMGPSGSNERDVGIPAGADGSSGGNAHAPGADAQQGAAGGTLLGPRFAALRQEIFGQTVHTMGAQPFTDAQTRSALGTGTLGAPGAHAHTEAEANRGTMRVQQDTIINQQGTIQHLQHGITNAVQQLQGTQDMQVGAAAAGMPSGGAMPQPMPVVGGIGAPTASMADPNGADSSSARVSKERYGLIITVLSTHNIRKLPNAASAKVVATWLGQAHAAFHAQGVHVPTMISVMAANHLSRSMAEAISRQGISTWADFSKLVSDWTGLQPDLLRKDARDMLTKGVNMLPNQTVQAYFAHFMEVVAQAEITDADLTLQWFLQGMVPDLRVACIVDNDGKAWTDIRRLLTFATGKQTQIKAQRDAAHIAAHSTPHHHRQANKPSFMHPRKQHPMHANPVFATDQVRSSAFQQAAGSRGGRGRGLGVMGGSIGKSGFQGRGGGGGGRGRGGHGRGGGHGGYQPGRGGHVQGSYGAGNPPRDPRAGWPSRTNPLSYSQRAWCQSQGLCFRCFQHPEFTSLGTTADGKHTRVEHTAGWTCQNPEVAWPPSTAILPPSVSTANMPRQ
jgi:hypothetical protein